LPFSVVLELHRCRFGKSGDILHASASRMFMVRLRLQAMAVRRAWTPAEGHQKNRTATDQLHDAPRLALLFGKPVESAIKAAAYSHPRTGLKTR
jgi:hypothetical protein